MISIDLRGMDEVRRHIATAGKQAAYAASRALNKAAFAAMREGRQQIGAAFDRPAPWTLSSWRVRKTATKADLKAVIGWSDYLANKSGNAAEYYLSQHFFGGERKYKAHENRLRRAGLLPDGMNAVPGKAADDLGMIDARGNLKGSVITAILSGVGALSQSGSSGNAAGRKRWSAAKRAAGLVYWAGKPGPNTPFGIWVLDDKHGNGRGRLRPVIVFVRRARYRKRLDLQQIADKVVRDVFVREYYAEFEQAMRTAR